MLCVFFRGNEASSVDKVPQQSTMSSLASPSNFTLLYHLVHGCERHILVTAFPECSIEKNFTKYGFQPQQQCISRSSSGLLPQKIVALSSTSHRRCSSRALPPELYWFLRAQETVSATEGYSSCISANVHEPKKDIQPRTNRTHPIWFHYCIAAVRSIL